MSDVQSIEFFVAVTCAVMGSLFEYYVFCSYSDLSTSLRHPKNWKHREEKGDSEFHSAVQEKSTRKRSTLTVKIKLIVFGTVYFLLEFIAAAFLTIASLTPFRFLFIFYASAFRFCSRKKLRDENFVLVCTMILILGLVSGAVLVAPRDIGETVYPEGLKSFRMSTVSYSVPVTIFLLILYIVSRNDQATNVFAKYFGFGVCCTHFTYRDMQTLFKATLAGSIGGQALALVRINAESFAFIVATNTDDFEFSRFRPYFLLGLACALNILHGVFIHYGLSDLSLINPSLFMPIYILCFALSALPTSSIYLDELETLPDTKLVLYSIFISCLLFIVVVLAFYSLNFVDKNQKKRSKMLRKISRLKKAESIYEDAIQDEKDQPDWRPQGLRKLFNEPQHPNLWSLASHAVEISDSASEASTKNKDFLKDHTHGKNKYFDTTPNKFDAKYPGSEHTLVRPAGVWNPHGHSETDRVGENGTKSEVSSWKQVDAPGIWQVRGRNYIKDRVKVDSTESRMKLVEIDSLSFSNSPPVKCLSLLKDGFVNKHHVNSATQRPFMLVLNFLLPSFGNAGIYFIPREGVIDEVFAKQLTKFIDAESDDFRNERFKLLPGVAKGNFLIRNIVGQTPTIIGKKLRAEYFRGPNWFEISVDVSSSAIGKSVFSSVKGFAKNLVLQLGFLLEGKDEIELPERLIGTLTMAYPILKASSAKELSTETIVESEKVKEELEQRLSTA